MTLSKLRKRHEAVVREILMLAGECAGSITTGRLGLINSGLTARLNQILKVAGVEMAACSVDELIRDALADEKANAERRKAKQQPSAKVRPFPTKQPAATER